jgi:hypothetical protein
LQGRTPGGREAGETIPTGQDRGLAGGPGCGSRGRCCRLACLRSLADLPVCSALHQAVVAAVIATVKGRCKAKVLELTLAFLARLDPAYQWPAPIDLEPSPSTHVFDLLDYLDDAISDAVNAEELEKMSALRTAWRASWGDSPQAMIEGRREITFRCVKERAEAAVRSAAESI